MSKFDEKMSNMLNIPTTIEMGQSTPDVFTPDMSETQKELTAHIKDDYDDTRKNLQAIISKGVDAIDDILKIARESEHPRAFEVAATMIKNVADVNDKLMNLQKQMKEITGSNKQTGTTNIGTAAIFVGSTAELSKMIKNEIKTIDGTK